MFKTDEDVYIIDEEAELSMAEEQKENQKALYNVLDEKYIQDRQITENNIKTKFKEIGSVVLDITDMYVYEKSQNAAVYIVKRKYKRKENRKNNRSRNFTKTRYTK
ncbi:MAG: hypothetical protein HFJ50_09355 [Clostridia bacterium]|nr:hypothetical protein [Clostridia bacterium]